MFMTALPARGIPSAVVRPIVILLALAACSSGPVTSASLEGSVPAETSPASVIADASDGESEHEREPIEVSLSLYVMSETDADTGLGTQRSVADVEAIAADIAPIWARADVIFDPIRVLEIEVPASVLADIATSGRTEAFFAEAGRTFDIPEASDINGFYVREAAGVNGFTPIGSRVFFVVDEPSVNDRRVSSHEIGHIFGLHHELIDQTRLMFSGTNGESLTEAEQAVARYGAQGVVDGLR